MDKIHVHTTKNRPIKGIFFGSQDCQRSKRPGNHYLISVSGWVPSTMGHFIPSVPSHFTLLMYTVQLTSCKLVTASHLIRHGCFFLAVFIPVGLHIFLRKNFLRG